MNNDKPAFMHVMSTKSYSDMNLNANGENGNGNDNEGTHFQKRTSTLSVSANQRTASPHRSSVYSVVDDAKRWRVFLEAGEELVMTGLTGKPNPVGIQLAR